MPPRKRYKEYLQDVSVHVPTRTKHRYKRSAQQSESGEALEPLQTLPSDASTDGQSDVDLSDVSDQQHRNDSSPVPPGASEQVDVLHQEGVSDDSDGSDVSACGETSSSDESDSDSDFPRRNWGASSSDASSICSDSTDEPSEVENINIEEPCSVERTKMVSTGPFYCVEIAHICNRASSDASSVTAD